MRWNLRISRRASVPGLYRGFLRLGVAMGMGSPARGEEGSQWMLSGGLRRRGWGADWREGWESHDVRWMFVERRGALPPVDLRARCGALVEVGVEVAAAAAPAFLGGITDESWGGRSVGRSPGGGEGEEGRSAGGCAGAVVYCGCDADAETTWAPLCFCA